MNSFTAKAHQAFGPLALVPCSNYFSFPDNKYYNQKQLGEGRACFSLHFTVHHPRKSKQELEAGAWPKSCRGTVLTGSVQTWPRFTSVCVPFLYNLGRHVQGYTSPVWTKNASILTIKKLPHRSVHPRANLMETTPQLRSPVSGMSKWQLRWATTPLECKDCMGAQLLPTQECCKQTNTHTQKKKPKNLWLWEKDFSKSVKGWEKYWVNL